MRRQTDMIRIGQWQDHWIARSLIRKVTLRLGQKIAMARTARWKKFPRAVRAFIQSLSLPSLWQSQGSDAVTICTDVGSDAAKLHLVRLWGHHASRNGSQSSDCNPSIQTWGLWVRTRTPSNTFRQFCVHFSSSHLLLKKYSFVKLSFVKSKFGTPAIHRSHRSIIRLSDSPIAFAYLAIKIKRFTHRICIFSDSPIAFAYLAIHPSHSHI